MRNCVIKGLRCSVLLAGASLSAAAYAQAPEPAAAASQTDVQADAGETPTTDIVVTAQRRSESLQKVPMTVNVATGEQIQKLAIFDFKDVQRLAAGLELTNDNGRQSVATLRGITYNPDSAGTPAVDIYFNEIPVDAQVFFGGIYDVGQIEVLRGPQGIFRGRTSPAGSITQTSKRPNLDEPEGYVQVTGTSLDGINAQGAASIPLVPGKLALRAALLADSNHGNQVRNITLDNKRSSAQTMSGRLSLAFTPSDSFKAYLTYQHFHSDTHFNIPVFGPGNATFGAAEGIPGLDVNMGGFLDPSIRSGPALTIEDRKATSGITSRFGLNDNIVTLDTETALTDDITWSLNAGYEWTRQTFLQPTEATNAIPGSTSKFVANCCSQKTTTIDTRIASSGPGFFNWMVGAFYSRLKGTSDLSVNTVSVIGTPLVPLPESLGTPVNVGVHIPFDNDQKAVFGSARFNFSDRLRLETGLRYTRYKFDLQTYLTTCLPTLGFCPLNNFGTVAPDLRVNVYKALTGGATLSYDFSPITTAYVNYGRSYRPGVAAQGITTPVASQSLILSQPEKSNSVEVGLKTSMLNRRLGLNVDVFYQKFNGYIDHINNLTVREIDPATGLPALTAISTNTNGDAISKGIEGQLTGRLTRNWDVGINASYIVAKYDNAVVPCNQVDANGLPFIPAGDEVALCTRNDRIAQVPRFTLSANTEYRFDMGSVSPFIRGLVSYRPGFNSPMDNYNYRAFTNVTLYTGVRDGDGRWEVSLFVKNLLDQARATRVLSPASGTVATTALDPVTFLPVGPGAPFSSGYRQAVITNPREFGLTARFNW